MPLTGTNVRSALAAVGAVGGQMTSFDNLAAGATSALLTAPRGLTVQGAAAFLATQAQESAFFRTTEEYAKNGRYAPYIGRTFDQLTWRSNYAAFGLWCYQNRLISDPNYFVNNPKRLADYQWAWLGGVWFFDHNGLWKYANAGNFLAVSQGVNGGNGTIGSRFVPAGYSVRLKMYNSFLALGNALLPGGNHNDSTPLHADTGQDLNAWISTANVKKIQTILKVTADGVAGPDTVNALIVKAGYAKEASPTLDVKGSNTIKKVQARINQTIGTKLVVDGVLGSATGKAIGTYLSKGGKLTNLAAQSITVKPKPAPVIPKTTIFPLKGGVAYAVNDGTNFTKSGVNKADQANIKKIQSRVKVTADGIYGAKTKDAVLKFQRAHRLTADGQVGPATWKALGL